MHFKDSSQSMTERYIRKQFFGILASKEMFFYTENVNVPYWLEPNKRRIKLKLFGLQLKPNILPLPCSSLNEVSF